MCLHGYGLAVKAMPDLFPQWMESNYRLDELENKKLIWIQRCEALTAETQDDWLAFNLFGLRMAD